MELAGCRYGFRDRFWEGFWVESYTKCTRNLPRKAGDFAPCLSGQVSGAFCIGFPSKALLKPAPETLFAPRKLYHEPGVIPETHPNIIFGSFGVDPENLPK